MSARGSRISPGALSRNGICGQGSRKDWQAMKERMTWSVHRNGVPEAAAKPLSTIPISLTVPPGRGSGSHCARHWSTLVCVEKPQDGEGGSSAGSNLPRRSRTGDIGAKNFSHRAATGAEVTRTRLRAKSGDGYKK